MRKLADSDVKIKVKNAGVVARAIDEATAVSFFSFSILYLYFASSVGTEELNKSSSRCVNGTKLQSFRTWGYRTKQGFVRKTEKCYFVAQSSFKSLTSFFHSYSFRGKFICKYRITINIDP